MRATLLVLALVGCTDKPYVLDTSDTADTGITQCGRIRGTEAVLMFQEGGATLRSPLETPNEADAAYGIAGPLGDDRTYVAAGTGRSMLSVDGGCNWEPQGSLAAGDWRLRAAGTRVYAFDMASAAGARSDDFGLTWTPFSTGELFVGVPVVDPADPQRIRGLQASGVVTSTDGGDTWSVGAALPSGLSGAADGDLLASNLDTAVVGGITGAWLTTDAGTTWTPVITDAAVTALAIHPDNGQVIFAQTTATDGVRTLTRTADAGGTWARQVDSDQVQLSDAPEIWPIPGNPLQALASYGPLFNADVDSDGVNLYILTAGEGTRTFFVGTWFHMHQVAFGEDRWLIAADATNGG